MPGITADRRGRLTIRLTVPSAGKADVSATARRRGRTTRIARARRTVRSAGSVRLTLRARRPLRRGAKITVRLKFTPPGGKAQTVSRSVRHAEQTVGLIALRLVATAQGWLGAVIWRR